MKKHEVHNATVSPSMHHFKMTGQFKEDFVLVEMVALLLTLLLVSLKKKNCCIPILAR